MVSIHALGSVLFIYNVKLAKKFAPFFCSALFALASPRFSPRLASSPSHAFFLMMAEPRYVRHYAGKAVCNIRSEVLRDYYHRTKDQEYTPIRPAAWMQLRRASYVRRYAFKGKGELLVAFQDPDHVGGVLTFIEKEHTICILLLTTRRATTGYGRLLFDAAKEIARARGMEGIEITSSAAWKESVLCLCRQDLRQSTGEKFMICCDDCDAWFHGSCVGIDEDNEPVLFKCVRCIQ